MNASKSHKAGLLIIFVTVFIDLLGFGIVLPLLPRYGKYFEAGGWTLGLLMSSFSAMQFLFAPIWGRVSDRVGRRPILILGLAGSTTSYALFGLATSLGKEEMLLGMDALTWLFITRIGAGVFGATIPTAQAYIADVTGPKERAKGMALIGAAFGIGFTFGPLLGAAFVSAQLGGPPSAAPGYVAAVLSGCAMLSAIFVLPESLHTRATPGEPHRFDGRRWLDARSLHQAVASRAIGLILLTTFLMTFVFGKFENTLPLLTQRLGLAERSNFFVFAYIGFVLSVSQGVLVRRLVPHLGEFRMCVIGTVLSAIGLVLVGIAGQANSTGMLYAVLPVGVVGFSALTPSLQSLLSLHTPATEQGAMLGLGQSVSALARILGPLVGIVLFEWHFTYPYWSGAALMVVGMLLVFAMKTPPLLHDEEPAAAPSEE